MIERDLCIVGHGRGATSYAAEWLQRNGLDVLHERMGSRGIVDSAFSVPGFSRVWADSFLTRAGFSFKHKLCIVRNPWKTIATFDAVEHPRAVWEHGRCIDLSEAKQMVPFGFAEWAQDKQEEYLDTNRAIRLNAIALSVVRWTQAGMEWAEGWKRAEDQWPEEMPAWLSKRGLWPAGQGVVSIPGNTVNHRLGNRLSRDEIATYLLPATYALVADFSWRLGYAD